MSKLFSFLFKRSAVPPSCDVLSDASPITEPDQSDFVLWHHQKAMLHRVLAIEAYDLTLKVSPSNIMRYNEKHRPDPLDVGIGIMNDPPGCGKTHVMLALIAMDKLPTTNIVIVPPNLHLQWIQAIYEYFPNGVKYLAITEYKDTLQLYNKDVTNKLFKGLRIILTSSTFADAVASGLSVAKVDVDRVIIDEVDTITAGFHNIPKCKRVWFMSASFNPTSHKEMGPFDLAHMSEAQIGSIVCRCDPQFMRKHQAANLPEPETKVIQIEDDEIMLLKDIISNEQLTQLNALNVAKTKVQLLRNNSATVTSVMELARLFLQDLEEQCDILSQRLAKFDDIDVEEFSDVSFELLELQTSIRVVQEKRDLLRSRIASFDLNPFLRVQSETKLDVVRKICDDVQQLDAKWMFFSDDDALFDLVQPILKEKGVKHVTLSEGTVKKNEIAIAAYKEDAECKVILVNSMKDGVGLNLENTTHILFLHYTNPQLVEQVIGRAQRPGRKTQLNIVCVYYKNETPIIDKN